uniref:Uncharacterized protein n=1 Tax=Zea mays TaxID=4577 RepID=C4IZ99_MAIZE|nr:unknown [Zea mays]ACR37330.1 unknown [Zea mays]
MARSCGSTTVRPTSPSPTARLPGSLVGGRRGGSSPSGRQRSRASIWPPENLRTSRRREQLKSMWECQP